MIDPKHNCSWSRKKRTEISLSGTRAHGAGVSLRVLLHGLVVSDRAWYSLISRDYDDNVLVLAVDPEVAKSLANRPYPQSGPMQQALDGRDDFVEYELDGEIRSALGITTDENSFNITRSEHIERQIYVHDDCFFFVEPVDETELSRLISGVLEQHSFYLDCEVAWAAVLGQLILLLKRVGTLQIQSEPSRRRLILSWKEPDLTFLRRILGRRSRHIRIQNGEARFAE
jgi:hypothetical protein